MSRPARIDPIAVFDAGIGSYALAERIHRLFPAQDVLNFAIGPVSPYGAKMYAELLDIIRTTILTLYQLGAAAVVIAPNAPTIMVLDELRRTLPLPVLGVYPPISVHSPVRRPVMWRCWVWHPLYRASNFARICRARLQTKWTMPSR